MKRNESLACNIVNQLFDLAEVPVEVRQAINDRATEWVLSMIQGNEDQIREGVYQRLMNAPELSVASGRKLHFEICKIVFDEKNT